jgi:hypothetical protein
MRHISAHIQEVAISLIELYTYILVVPGSNVGQNTVWTDRFNILKSTGYVMHQQFNIQQLYALPTLYLDL